MVQYMQKEHKFEKEHGHGDEIGPITDQDLLQNETYKELRKSFLIHHAVSVGVNLVGFVSMGVYISFHSGKLNL